jgi:PPM family protein phosphatase
MPLTIVEEFALSDVGRQRQTNEDSFLESSPIFAVADGMGGARAGEVASRLAVETFSEQRDESASPEAQLAEVARTANRKIYTLAQEDSSRAGMGTTLTAVMVHDGELAIGHVGDSRAYRFRDGGLERLTQDHSLVEELVRQGKIKPEEAATHPQRSIITRALGPEPEVDVETLTYSARPGDVYLLCSDGLTGMVEEGRMAEILREGGSLEAAGTKLVAEANENGGRDNITVVLFRVDDGDGDSEDPDTLSGQATRVGGVEAETVRAAVRDADEAEARQATRATPVPQTTEPGDVPEPATMALGPEQAREARALDGPAAEPRADATAVHTVREPERERPPRVPRAPEGRPRRRWLRPLLAGLGVLIVVTAICAGLYTGSRQFYFVGTNDRGVVTMYRGLPYDLPFGVDLYEEEYVTAVPADSLQPARRRERIVDQQLRSRGDAADLIRTVEEGR